MSKETKDKKEEKKQVNKAELAMKVAEASKKGVAKIDEMVDKRSVMGEFTAPITVGLLLILVVSLINSPGLLIIGALGVALGFAPKIVSKVIALKEAQKAKKEAKEESKKEAKKEE